MKKHFTLALLLLFILDYSQVGINNSDPKSALHITPIGNEDPLILSNIKTLEDPVNRIDGDKTSYSNLIISEHGVIRKENRQIFSDPNRSTIIDLEKSATVNSGSSEGAGGTILEWVTTKYSNGQYIILPESGSYVFSFRLYGQSYGVNIAASQYISAWKEGASSPSDIAEMNVMSSGANADAALATYSINLTLSGNTGDKVYFKIAYYPGNSKQINWVLLGNPGMNANKTSMIFWRS